MSAPKDTSYETKEFVVESSNDGVKLAATCWKPQKVERVVVIQHGFGEHCRRYGNLIDTMAGTGTVFYALDARGHGKSPGKRGHVDDFHEYIDDMKDFIELVRKENNNEKIYLVGHSLGGLMSIGYAVEHQDNLRGLYVSSPALGVHMDMDKTIKKYAAKVFSMFCPSVTLDANVDVKNLSHDPAVIEAYNADDLVHGKISFKMGLGMFNLGPELLKQADKITAPILLTQGGADAVVVPAATEEFYDKVSSTDKTLKIYPGLFHETMNEASPEKEKVLQDVKAWLLAEH